MNDETELKHLEAEHYFDELEDMIVQRMRSEASTSRARAELMRSTGVDDPVLIDELSELGITVDEIIALRFLPLVLVAWAEETADTGERDVVRAEAAEIGIHEDSSAWILLDSWLRNRPPGIGVDAWKRYTHKILKNVSPLATQRLLELTRKQMTNVAKASGGHLGFGKVSQKERTMIERLITIMQEQASPNGQ
ncbi:hypothetical protein NHH03_10100 [Stieleria sp. TO1_6]|uniref:hypothetical protein n=1 Tax=Stieleria tagensis TaxID=2956795 RepID=UPI00209B16C0|nr:hypothetical protein [Stieleria tagensis]MCO8122090.1 hypothetical protein [Stieleria tagensis]